MIICIGNYTFPIAIMLVFRTKLYLQHLPSLFWLLLTIPSILSVTTFPLLSDDFQISADLLYVPHFQMQLYKPDHCLTVTKIKCL